MHLVVLELQVAPFQVRQDERGHALQFARRRPFRTEPLPREAPVTTATGLDVRMEDGSWQTGTTPRFFD